MRRIVLSVFVAAAAIVSLVALLSAQAPSPAAPPAQVTFAKDVQPILEKSCFSCHSADLKLGELDLSTRDAAVAGGAHGAALVPGSAERSKLYRMAAGLDQPKMPMQGDALKPAELAALAGNEQFLGVAG
jgi:mono/diheme cytochrome c family protein